MKTRIRGASNAGVAIALVLIIGGAGAVIAYVLKNSADTSPKRGVSSNQNGGLQYMPRGAQVAQREGIAPGQGASPGMQRPQAPGGQGGPPGGGMGMMGGRPGGQSGRAGGPGMMGGGPGRPPGGGSGMM